MLVRTILRVTGFRTMLYGSWEILAVFRRLLVRPALAWRVAKPTMFPGNCIIGLFGAADRRSHHAAPAAPGGARLTRCDNHDRRARPAAPAAAVHRADRAERRPVQA